MPVGLGLFPSSHISQTTFAYLKKKEKEEKRKVLCVPLAGLQATRRGLIRLLTYWLLAGGYMYREPGLPWS